MDDLFLLIFVLLIVLAIPISGLAVRGLAGLMPRAKTGSLVVLAGLVPAVLLLTACIVRLNIQLYREDWGALIVVPFIYVGVPLSLAVGAIAAAWTLRRIRGDQEA